ncbi:ComEC family protein [Affinibrenneria salicis]|uniref:ComEC family protein n=1 Tax=Affinibrenneria salicis TaxID=2590031 RepID=A0A5J5G2P0_9GAMM|nr:ComEC family protein [Affinibrenneria salicis]KAA9001128.1 ComEC family protein [Affinibrenneria salicis]
MLPYLFLAELPSAALLAAGGGVALLLSWRPRGAVARSLALMLVGFIWAGLASRDLLRQMELAVGQPVNAQVVIDSVRLAHHEDAAVIVRLATINQRRVFPPLYASIRFDAGQTPWCGGQRWLMSLRLRPVHSRLNQGGFDRQRWALARRQPLSGRALAARPLEADCHLRQRMVTHAARQVSDFAWRDILLALAFGEMKSVTDELRLLLQQTGTMHLMAISGLHIALAALFGWGAARAGQWFLPVGAIGYRWPLLFSGLVAWIYVWLAGGNPPAVRAGLALSLWILLRLYGVRCTSWQIWLWCIALILLYDPLSVLSDSFWLSCLAVAALIFWFQWAPLPRSLQCKKRWLPVRWFYLQSGMTLLLLPLQIGLFHGVSLLSLPANLWAVPLVSFITTPLILAALPLLALPAINAPLWWLADRSLYGVFAPLSSLQSGWLPTGETALSVSAAGWLAVTIWRFHWWREHPASVFALMVALIFPQAKRPASLWRLDMLDIGHGLAIAIEKQGRVVLYDSGNRWDGGDMASLEIVPWLRWRGLTPEKLILSHSHMDHIGGLDTLRTVFPALTVHSSFRQPGHLSCRQGDRWLWQGLTFEVLWPPRRRAVAGNNDSCVIRIDDGRWRVLLTGDLEKQAELALVTSQRQALPADLLQIPHHGSNSSSTPPFIRAVNPRLAIASAARYNAWRLPSRKVILRYRQQGTRWHDTAVSGQLSVHFFSDSWQINGFREQLKPRWYHQWFGVREDNG